MQTNCLRIAQSTRFGLSKFAFPYKNAVYVNNVIIALKGERNRAVVQITIWGLHNGRRN